MEKEKHFFASANTGDGFYNRFNDIAPEGFLYVLKGGPGTGKSTLMKRVGEHFKLLGFTIEFFHCSSDINSLDGIRIVEKNIAVVDGTAPHVTEAQVPNISGKIINVGEFISEDVRKNRIQICEYIAKKTIYYSQVYSYLKVSKELLSLLLKEELVDYRTNHLDTMCLDIFNNVNVLCQKDAVYCRKLFLKCGSSDDNSLININNFANKYILKLPINEGDYLMRKLLEKLYNEKIEVFKIANNVNPDILDGIYISAIDTLVYNEYEKYYEDKSIVQNDDIKLAYLNYCRVMNVVNKKLKMAKRVHKKIEKYYIKNMDFLSLNKCVDKLILEIENKK